MTLLWRLLSGRNRRPIRLARELAAHDRDEAAIADRDGPAFGGADCGCRWQYLEGGHLRVDLCDRHAFICLKPDGKS